MTWPLLAGPAGEVQERKARRLHTDLPLWTLLPFSQEWTTKAELREIPDKSKQLCFMHFLIYTFWLFSSSEWGWLHTKGILFPSDVSHETTTATGLWVCVHTCSALSFLLSHLLGPRQTNCLNMQVGKYGSSMTLSSVSRKRPVRILNFPAKELPTHRITFISFFLLSKSSWTNILGNVFLILFIV